MGPTISEAEASEIGEEGPKKRAHRAESPEGDVSRDFLARVLSVDLKSITNFANEGMPKTQRGRFPLGSAVQWYVARQVEKARGGKGLNDLDEARRRHETAKAELTEIELAEKRGAVLPASVYEDELTKRCEAIAGAVKAIGRYQPDVKAAVTDEVADALLERMADEILAELHGLTDVIE